MRPIQQSIVIAAAGLLLAASAAAQDYPSRQINMVIPFPPGGNTDLMARALQPELAKALGQSVVAVNKGRRRGISVTSSGQHAPTATPSDSRQQSADRATARAEAPYGMESFRRLSHLTRALCRDRIAQGAVQDVRHRHLRRERI